MRLIRRFFNNLLRSLEYAALGWTNRDGDYAYVAKILAWKLERLQKVLEQDDMHCHSKHRARQVMTVKALINRIITNNYCQDEEAEWWAFDEFDLFDSEPQALHALKTLYRKQEAALQQDIDLAGKLIRKHYRSWWI